MSDLVVGAYGDDDGTSGSGAVYILFMTTSGVVKSSQKISNLYGNLPFSIGTNGQWGVACSSVQDINGDGVDDMVVTSSWDNDGGYHSGAAFVLFMSGSQ